MAKLKVQIRREGEIIEINRLVIYINDQEYVIMADQQSGLDINKSDSAINIQPKVSNNIRIY